MKGLDIAFVEKDQDLREFMAAHLANKGNSIFHFRNYQAISPSNKYDVYVLDWGAGDFQEGFLWLTLNNHLVPAEQRILTSYRDKWKDNQVSGIYIDKPYTLPELERAINLSHGLTLDDSIEINPPPTRRKGPWRR